MLTHFTNKFSFLLLPILLLSVVCKLEAKTNNNSFINSASLYAPQIELNLKVGNTRHIGRIGLLFPILQNENNLLFSTIIGMRDSKSNTEGNFGLGYKSLINNLLVLGGYGFFDIRNTEQGNLVNQITFGGEILFSDIEFRANYYLPFKDKYEINKNTIITNDYYNHRTERYIVRNVNYETIVSGFDIEVGGNLPQYDKLQGFITYYNFSKKSELVQKGIRFRAEWKVLDFLALEAECNKDEARKNWVNYVGIKLNYSFGDKDRHASLTKLQKKMIMSYSLKM